jgi:hypothetical protein
MPVESTSVSSYGNRHQIGKPTANAVNASNSARRLKRGRSQDRRGVVWLVTLSLSGSRQLLDMSFRFFLLGVCIVSEIEVVKIEPLIVRKEAAAKLLGDMALSTLEKMTSKKQIPHLKIGTAVYYDVADLRGWIEAKKIPAEKLAR